MYNTYTNAYIYWETMKNSERSKGVQAGNFFSIIQLSMWEIKQRISFIERTISVLNVIVDRITSPRAYKRERGGEEGERK